jgi:hypothetical protein
VALAVSFISLLVTWLFYVPVHELLHVLGCVASGGSVSRLEIAPQYGGTILARWFSFVVSGGDYAGRLSGFDTRGSDLVYLATDATPFLLSVVVGVPLLLTCRRRPRPARFGAAAVVGLAPFYNIMGDYYEMGSILLTRALAVLTGRGDGSFAAGLRSDDIFKLVADMMGGPNGVDILPLHSRVLALTVVAMGFSLGVGLALATYALGRAVGQALVKSPVPASVCGH